MASEIAKKQIEGAERHNTKSGEFADMTLSAEDFWTFSLDFYGKQNVAKSCLSLQDRRDADVNILLLAAYLASKGHVLDDTHLSIADGMTAGWRAAVLQQLRQVRRRLPKFAEEVPEGDRKNVKEKILEAELAAEQVAHRLIFKRLDDAPMPTEGGTAKERAEKNLKLYLRRLLSQSGPGGPDERDLGDLSAIVGAM
ncbi:MAG TPA: TIGR02444 family protein [Dongiaceae bacterium]|nr:TIGR02444 family protein [Dongiaceae bacterium]